MPSPPPKKKILLTLAKDSVKIEIEQLEPLSNILSVVIPGKRFLPLTAPAPFKLIFIDNFGNSKVFNTILT